MLSLLLNVVGENLQYTMQL